MEWSLSLTGQPMSIRFATSVVAGCLAVSACAPARSSLDAIAARYVRATLALQQHDPSLVDTWHGSDRLRPGPRGPVKALLEDITTLQGELEAVAPNIASAEEQGRLRYLTSQLRALRFAAERQLGRAATIDEQAREEFGITFAPLDPVATQATLAAVDRLLPGTAPRPDRVSALRLRTRVPRDRQRDVFEAAIAACKDASAGAFSLPKDDEIEIVFSENLPWDGFARHLGNYRTRISINDAAPLDVSRALRLACHEGYPGHHVQHLLRDQLFETRQWVELQLTPMFGRHLLLAEGAAEVGADLAFPAGARTAIYRDKLFPAAGLDPAAVDTLVQLEELTRDLLPVITDVGRRYLDHTITKEEARERLADEALVSDPATLLAFIERRRGRALVYGEGRRIVYALLPTRDLPGLRAALAAGAVQ
jgi:hypothetical protein